jgi:hypothetical protein
MTERSFDLADAAPRDGAEAVAGAFEVSELTVHRRLELATARARRAAAAVSVAQAELVDAVRDVHAAEGALQGCTSRQWVGWQCGLTHAETREVFALAKVAEELPRIDEAFRRGELSPGVAATMARVATPENEQVLLDAARDATGQQLQVLVRDFRSAQRAKRGNPPADADPAVMPSRMSAGWNDDGRFAGSFDLRPDEGAVFEAALETGLAVGRGDDKAPAPDDVVEGDLRPTERPARRTKADALLELAISFLANHADQDGNLGEIYQVIVHRDLLANGEAQLSIPGCGTLDERIAAMVQCDSIELTQDEICGFPVSAPIRKHPFSLEQRRALRARDRCCIFPGCGRTRRLQAHHLHPYGEGGETSVPNGGMLCGYHHWLIHQTGATLALKPDRTVMVTRRDGSTITSAPRPPPPVHAIPRPPPMPADRRLAGANERLTTYARGCYLDSLQRASG